MKKVFAMLLALVMVLAAVSFASAEGYNGKLKVWVAENTLDFTNAMIQKFKEANPEYAGMEVAVEPVGEGDAASNMITDVDAGADIFCFAQDQLARLVSAGALEEVEPGNAERIKAENAAAAVEAVTIGGVIYAYPMTSDNGYFLYYDSSVVSDPSTLEGILKDCEAAGKNFYMEINSGWYQTAFFFGAGCDLSFETDVDGRLVSMNASYASPEGVRAMKAMIALSNSPAFVNGSSVSNATNLAAIVDGVWDSASAKAAFGDNYAACKLPTVDGFQMSGFSGYKMLGVKPQTDDAKLAACDALAAYLTSEEVQLARFEDENIGWGPSNLKAMENEDVQNNVALTAVREQMALCKVQGQYPGNYWALATALGDDIIADKYDNASDEELLSVLQGFQDTCETYLDK